MKTILVLLNIILALALGHGVWTAIAAARAEEEDPYFIRRNPDVRPAAPARVTPPRPNRTPAAATGIPAKELSAVVAEHNIFDPSRCPNARVFGRRTTAKLDMTLVGTFEIGEIKGAVILQKKQASATQQFPWMQPGMMPQPGMMMPQNNNNFRQRAGGMQVQRFGPMMNQNRGGDTTAQQAEENLVYKQYVRLGETMANGYQLLSVTRTSATLSKGAEKLDLTLVEASKNAGASTGKNASNNGMPNNMTPEQMQMWMNQMRAARMGNMGNMGGAPNQRQNRRNRQ